MMTRRFLLAAAAISAASAAFPALPALSAETAPVATPLPAWVVGTPDCFNWQMVRAIDADAALREIAQSNAGGLECPGCDSADCDFCAEIKNLDVLRVAHMDNLDNPTAADWLRADCGHCCSRCGYETFPEEGGHPIGDEAICEDCMTPEDWQIADPERYAEMLAEAAEETS